MWRNTEQIHTSIHSSDVGAWEHGQVPPQALSQQAANDSASLPLSSPSLSPATRAVIHKRGTSTTSSGRARSCEWVLSFQPVSGQFIEPLMGWCGGDDPLRHLELRFPTREAAVRYAQRHGIVYEVCEPSPERHAHARCPDDTASLWKQWMLECLGTFEAGAQWCGNDGSDERLIATLERLEQNARATEAVEPVPAHQDRIGAPAPDAALRPPVPANANVPQVSEEAGVA